MIKLTMDKEKLKEAYDIAEREGRTVLGVIYNEYICPYFPLLDTLNPRNIYANRDLVLKMIELDKKLNTEGVETMYLQYGPSTDLVIPVAMNEIMVVL